MPSITITTPGGAPQRFEFSPNRETVLLGRSSKCDIQISCASVSGNHAKVRRLAEGYVLRDLGSTNGTKLDGEKTSEIHLKQGQRIHLGDVAFKFEPDPQQASAMTTILDAEDAPKSRPKSESKPGSEPPQPPNNPLVLGLALAGGGLVALGFLVLLGFEAFAAIADRDPGFILGGSALILTGLLCLGSILLATGRIRLPKLVVRFEDDDEDDDNRERTKSRKEPKDDEEGEDSDEDDDGDEADLGKKPKDEQAATESERRKED